MVEKVWDGKERNNGKLVFVSERNGKVLGTEDYKDGEVKAVQEYSGKA